MESEKQPPAEPEPGAVTSACPPAGQVEKDGPTGGQPPAPESGAGSGGRAEAAATDDGAVGEYTGPDLSGFAERIVEARDRHADFDDVAFDPDLPVSMAMAETIARSGSGPEIAYYLGRNPAVAARIAQLEPLAAAHQLGRLEAQLDPPRRSVTAAPPPLRALGGSEQPQRLPADMSYDEYRRWRSRA